MIRLRQNIEQGVNLLISASELVNDDVDILVKLATVILQDLIDRPDYVEKCDAALDRVIDLEPYNSDALFLKGKLLHKQENYERAITYI
jgi:hypothetical protein